MSNNRDTIQHRLLLIAGSGLIAVGIGHFLVLLLLRWTIAAGWFADGFWGAVPFIMRTPTLESLSSSATFWSGIGGFAVPLALVGALVVHLDRQSLPVPAWLGWAIGVWGLVAALLLDAPTPFFALPVLGTLIVIAHRRAAQPTALRGEA